MVFRVPPLALPGVVENLEQGGQLPRPLVSLVLPPWWDYPVAPNQIIWEKFGILQKW